MQGDGAGGGYVNLQVQCTHDAWKVSIGSGRAHKDPSAADRTPAHGPADEPTAVPVLHPGGKLHAQCDRGTMNG
jgi:hypothetical protein